MPEETNKYLGKMFIKDKKKNVVHNNRVCEIFSGLLYDQKSSTTARVSVRKKVVSDIQ